MENTQLSERQLLQQQRVAEMEKMEKEKAAVLKLQQEAEERLQQEIKDRLQQFIQENPQAGERTIGFQRSRIEIELREKKKNDAVAHMHERINNFDKEVEKRVQSYMDEHPDASERQINHQRNQAVIELKEKQRVRERMQLINAAAQSNTPSYKM